MGAPAGAGGSDSSDERKVDTYADQLKKEQARKSKFKTNKFGYKVKKNVFERIGDNHPVYQGVKNVADKLNLNRRMKFANKTGVNIQGLSTEEILSDNFKSKLEAKGYKTSSNTNNNTGGGNDNTPAPTIIKKTAGGQTIQTTAPTEAELSQSAAADATAVAETKKEDDIYTRKKKSKARGRSMMTLTGPRGLSKDEKLTLGKPSLLGS